MFPTSELFRVQLQNFKCSTLRRRTAVTKHDYLRRLPREHYVGQAYVHWSLTMEERSTGWLADPNFLLQAARNTNAYGVSFWALLPHLLLYARPYSYALDRDNRRL